MRKIMLIMLVCGFLFYIHGQTEIFKSKLCGMEVQTYNPNGEIDSLTVYTSGEWVFMRAWSAAGYGDIIGTKNTQTALQEAKPPAGYITGFTASGPDAQGYVYLTAVSDGGFSVDIIRTKWSGTGTQSFTAPAGFCINGFIQEGPDANGYVYLSVNTGQVGIEEREDNQEKGINRLTFALGEISPNPCADYTRIFYSIARKSLVHLRIYDNAGRLVKTLTNATQVPGRYNLSWGGVDEAGRFVPSGIYFVKLDAGDFSATRKLLLIR